ncbi:MAG: hypothetical protein KAU58_00115 [Candidatus Omnitrophica bacterium]|nr:hypothetical protein [Candidatus Omnitrophota bacterium]
MVRDLRLRLKEEELCRLYLREKKSLEDIARLYGVSRVAVWKYCRASGLTRRNRSEARLEAQKKEKVPQRYIYIKDKFFSVWNSEMAYILGLLMTDGCLSRAQKGSYRISLCLNDKELLEKVAKTMGSDHAIVLSKYQKSLYIFIFGRRRLIEDLMILGMKPRKSLNLRFPEVPKEYLRDFIRGVFDGDGSVYFETRSPKHPLVSSFVSGSKLFIYELERKLQELGMPRRNIYEQKGKNVSYSFKYRHKNSIKLFHLLYDEVNNGLYLERKINKFKKGAHNGKAG